MSKKFGVFEEIDYFCIYNYKPDSNSKINMNNNFNYSSIPGSLLYREHRHLDDFGVDEPDSLNSIIYEKLYHNFCRFSNYEEFVTSIFNCAYCICTRMHADSHPDRRIGAYVQEAYTQMLQNDYYTSIVLSIVLLQIRCHRWDVTPAMERLADTLEEEIKNSKCSYCYSLFYLPINEEALKISNSRQSELKLQPLSTFLPCEINIQILRSAFQDIDLIGRFGKDEDKMLEFIFAIGKNEAEQNLITSFLHDELHAAFTDGREHKYCFENIYYQIHKFHHAEEERAQIEAEIEADIEAQYMQQFEMDGLKDRVAQLEAENAQLRHQLTTEETLNAEEEMTEEPDDEKEQEDALYNKVRFEFFLRLLENAGFDINNTGNKTHVGELWHMFTDKSADEFRRYCSKRQPINHHTRPDVERLNMKLKELGISIQIDS